MVRSLRTVRVQDVMTAKVVVAHEDTPFKEIVVLMHRHGVSGLPVVDEQQRLVGIVTETDLLLAEQERGPEARPSLVEWFIHPVRLRELEERSLELRAEDIMTEKVTTVPPDLSVRGAIKRLLDAEVKRLPVVEEGDRVVGIVSRGDLLTPFLRPDGELEREIIEGLLQETMWLEPGTVEVVVSDSVVRLTGEVERRSSKEILVELVRRVDGVIGVDDRLTYKVDDRSGS